MHREVLQGSGMPFSCSRRTTSGRAVGFSRGRLRRAERATGGGPCSECGLSPDTPGRIVYRDRTDSGLDSLPEDPDELCPGCGRTLWLVIEVAYEDEEGEGASADWPM